MFDAGDFAVLGVDPGLAATGLAVVRRRSGKAAIAWAQTVRTSAGLQESARLRALHEAVRGAITEHRPQSLAVERVMWGRNVGSAMSVARATGVILLAAAQAGIGVEEYAPLEVKMAVTGVGNATKEVMRRALSRIHGLDGVPLEPDAADAVAVAFCHLQQARLRQVTGARS
ncbi:MAG: crossover junction endodeoxyribonuclease RuvC [Actinomycetota bacterium]